MDFKILSEFKFVWEFLLFWKEIQNIICEIYFFDGKNNFPVEISSLKVNISLDKLDTIILTPSEYFPLCLQWKSATFNFLLLHFANPCAMSTNINVIKCYEYIYFCKINWNVQLYITNWIRTFEKYSLNRFFSSFFWGICTISLVAEANEITCQYGCSMYGSYPWLRAYIMALQRRYTYLLYKWPSLWI